MFPPVLPSPAVSEMEPPVAVTAARPAEIMTFPPVAVPVDYPACNKSVPPVAPCPAMMDVEPPVVLPTPEETSTEPPGPAVDEPPTTESIPPDAAEPVAVPP